MMQKSTISLSFDDGREDTYSTAFQIMKQYGLTGTIHVTTGFIDKTWHQEKWSQVNQPVTIEKLKEMKDYGFEISSHGDKHLVESNDLIESINKLNRWNLIDKNVGFSIPESKVLSYQDNKKFIEFLEYNGVSYMRGGRNQQCYSLKNKFIFLLYCITKLQIFYNMFNNYNCNQTFNKYNLISVVIRNEDNPNKIIKFIKNNIKNNNWIILMLHSIQDEKSVSYVRNTWSWDLAKFEFLCSELKVLSDDKKISIKNIIDVIDEESENI